MTRFTLGHRSGRAFSHAGSAHARSSAEMRMHVCLSREEEAAYAEVDAACNRSASGSPPLLRDATRSRSRSPPADREPIQRPLTERERAEVRAWQTREAWRHSRKRKSGRATDPRDVPRIHRGPCCGGVKEWGVKATDGPGDPKSTPKCTRFTTEPSSDPIQVPRHRVRRVRIARCAHWFAPTPTVSPPTHAYNGVADKYHQALRTTVIPSRAFC